MPTTLAGLLIFIVLLLPGFAFTITKERNTPAARRSPFRETVEVAVASTVLGLAMLGILVGLRAAWPSVTPDPDQLIRDGSRYVHAEYARIAAWAAGLLVAATVAGGGVGWVVGRRPPYWSKMSSWWEMFESWYPGYASHVGCTLDDGSYVEGVVCSYSDLADETPDRDLILQAPIMLRLPGETESRPHGSSAVCISARRIVMMLVTPLPTKRGEPTSSPAEPSGPAAAEPAAAAAAAGSADDDPAHARDRAEHLAAPQGAARG